MEQKNPFSLDSFQFKRACAGLACLILLITSSTDVEAQPSTSSDQPILRVHQLSYDNSETLKPGPYSPPGTIQSLYIGNAPQSFNYSPESPPLPQNTSLQFPTIPSDWRFHLDRWTIRDGLPANKVRSLYQSSEGFLWIGTEDGFARFDGQTFTSYPKEQFPSLAQQRFTSRCFFEDSEHTLWIGTDQGLVRLRDYLLTPFPDQEIFRDVRVNDLSHRSEGGFWIATDKGLAQWNGRAIQWIDSVDLSGIDRIIQCLEYRGSLWLGTSSGLLEFDSGTNKIRNRWLQLGHDLDDLDPYDRVGVYDLMEDRKGKLWISTNIVGIWNYDPDSKGVTQIKKQPNTNLPNSFPAHARFTQDKQGTIWVGASDYLGGLLRFNEDSPSIERSHYDQIMGQTFDILSGREGALWVASREGLFRLRAVPFDSISFDGVGSRSGVRSIIEAANGQLWFGSRRVFASWAKETLTVADGLLSLKPSFTSSMFIDREAQLWVGYPRGGIAKLSHPDYPSQFAPQLTAQFSEIGELRGAALRSDGGLWLGTDKGLYSLSSSEEINSVSSEFTNISCLIEDRSQGLWVGTYDGGLGYRSKNDSQKITPLTGLPSKHIGAIYQDSAEQIWIGTEEGLVHIQQQTVLRPPLNSPLPQGRIDGIVEDDQQRLWISHEGGISRVHIQDAHSHFSNDLANLTVANFSTEHGISGVQRPSGIPPCNTALKSQDGRLWFTRYSGLLTVAPSKLPPNVPAPTVLIQKLTANGTSYNPIPNRLLPPGSGSVIEIKFTTASLYQPENVILDYRLKGMDTSWRRAERRRIATYLNLDPGNYELEVRARNHEGRWTEPPSSLRFKIAPHFFETWWFNLILFSSASGVIGFLLHRRFRQQRVSFESARLEALKKERTRIARDIHDHLGAQLSATALQSAPAAGELAADSLKELRDLIWSVDPEQDTLDGFIDFIADFSSRFLTAAEMELELDLPKTGIDRPFDQRIRLELAAVFKEALNNIVKHSNARRVDISLKVEHQRIVLTIQDDGVGMASQGLEPTGPPKNGSGNGLPNMRSRIKGLEGSFGLASKPDFGVKISIDIPAP